MNFPQVYVLAGKKYFDQRTETVAAVTEFSFCFKCSHFPYLTRPNTSLKVGPSIFCTFNAFSKKFTLYSLSFLFFSDLKCTAKTILFWQMFGQFINRLACIFEKLNLFFRDTFHYSNVSFSCLFSLRFKDLFLVDVDIIEGTGKEIVNKTAELQSTHFASHIFDFRNLVKVEFK